MKTIKALETRLQKLEAKQPKDMVTEVHIEFIDKNGEVSSRLVRQVGGNHQTPVNDSSTNNG